MSCRHTNSELRQAVDALEARGWTINADGTITRTQMQVKKITHDPRSKNAAPRYAYNIDGRTYTIKAADLVLAKVGRITAEFRDTIRRPEKAMQDRRAVAARERPDEVEVGLRGSASRRKRAPRLPA